MSKTGNERMEQLMLTLQEKERDLDEKQEELEAQRGMLTFAIDELGQQNKNLEKALTEVRERNAELRQLLYQSSHGLRSPLTSIQGVIHLIELEPLTETLLEYKHHMDFKISSMLEILNSLTTLSTLIAHELTLTLVNIDVLLADCMQYCSALALKKNVTMQSVVNNGTRTFRTDSTLVLAILKQVIMNAIIFREEKPGFVNIATVITEDTLVISVDDDGEGISPDIGNNIFNMFVRGSGRSGGSGLGLYIAKKAAELIKGSIEFTRNDGITIFTIHIPLHVENV